MNPPPSRPAPAPAAADAATHGQPQPILDSSELLRGAKLVQIRHNGELYRLQATRLGKLILTK